ncbi:MAG: hypothetical protein DMD86_00350 [Candidatus Rokuibacteriota bacterium]|nr:MAG: hypothetical protein DMD86_00350 [Candidatus Rokubacteria bacterium]
MNERRPRGRLVLAAVIALTFAGRGRAAEVNGIWSESSTKDLGELSGNDFFKNWKIRGWAESYFVYSSNAADKDTVNANQGLSAIKARDLSIEGRTFDVHRNRPTLTILEVELEKVPQLSSWLDPQAVGFKLDVNWGDTYDIIWNTVNKALGRPGHKEDVLGDADRFLSHYSIGYVAPVGKGLRVDFGKFVTHIGGETIESIKNNNFSHGYLYSFGIPFQDFGFRFNYPWTDTLYTEFYVLQGWNVTYKDNNGGKTIGPAIGWTPNPRVSMYAQYLGGPEQRDNDNHYRHLLDLGLSLNPIDPFNILLSADVGYERNVFSKKDTWWDGIMGVFRYKVTDAFEPAFRAEIYNDPDGFTTGVPQTVGEVTLTLNYRIDLPEKTHLLVRPEYRYDVSDANFFTEGKAFRDRKDQHTIGLGTVLYF